jgi:hypothetical protein
MTAKTTDFGVASVQSDQPSSVIIEKIQDDLQVSVSELKIAKSNPQYMPFIPLQSYKTVNGRRILNKINTSDEVDLTITAVLKPLKIVYRPLEVGKLLDFF